MMQSRGNYLTGGPREKQFHLFKTWANTYTQPLWETLADRYVMYGEWLYAKHTVFYTNLPHYFMEFDLYDKQAGKFLSTESRRALLQTLACVTSVKVLHEGKVATVGELTSYIGHSYFISDDHLARLRAICRERGLDVGQILKETDPTPLMEGLYIKVEEDGIVKERYKYVRASFLQAVFDSESHWMDRPIIPNELKKGTTLF